MTAPTAARAILDAEHPPLRTFSYGGGVQSTACLVLAAEGKIDFPTFLFANTGDDSENPKTLTYVREVATSYAEAHGIALHEVARKGETLYQRLTRPESRSIDIPVYLGSGAPGKRQCTGDYKVRVIARWLKAHGATDENPATLGMGISLDELHRARTEFDPRVPHQRRVYPLIDLRMDRQDCVNVIERAGLPVPPKSSCWFCPFARKSRWREMQRHDPELFEQAVELERTLNERRETLGRDAVYLTSALIPLDQVIVDTGQQEFDFSLCEGGYCHV
jgi:3'-phosphoadenosine 5'-phosphosulfate sulfotransferase (PAPS reductase)/FAD synthetase